MKVTEFLRNLDRRWIFLLMLLSILIPLLFGLRFPESPSPMVLNVRSAIEELPEGSDVLMAWDFDPASRGELSPMAAAFVRHCAYKKHKLYFLTLWATGGPLIQESIDLLNREFPGYEYGRDYVNMGFRPGSEGVIKVVVGDLKKLFANDVDGTSLDELPLTRNLKNIRQMDLIVNVSAGYPGTKEWVLYAATPYDLKIVGGTTGVTAPSLYPYIPSQLTGLLAAIKAAAEYEQAVIDLYPALADNDTAQEGLRRMGPQLLAHMLVLLLIVLGNVIYFWERRKGVAS